LNIGNCQIFAAERISRSDGSISKHSFHREPGLRHKHRQMGKLMSILVLPHFEEKWSFNLFRELSQGKQLEFICIQYIASLLKT